MGRPPIGKHAMTATERQRRWRQGIRQRPAQASPRNVPEQQPDRAPVEELRRQLDATHRELAAAMQGINLNPVADEGTHLCFICHRARGAMFEAARPYFHLYLCAGCIAEAASIAAKRASPST